MSTPGLAEHQDRHVHCDLAAGHDQDEVGRDFDAETPVQIRRHRLAQRRNAGRRRIAVLAVAQRLDRGLDDMGGGFEIGLADAEVDDVAPLALQLRRLGEHREGVLFADARKAGTTCMHSAPSLDRALFGAGSRAGDK